MLDLAQTLSRSESEKANTIAHTGRHSEMHVIQLAQATATVCLGYSAATIWASLAWPGWLVSTLKTLAATKAKASQVSKGGT